jgi:hypothetical protein
MKWFELKTFFQEERERDSRITKDVFIDRIHRRLLETPSRDEISELFGFSEECRWTQNRRPYFNVFPALFGKLQSVSLRGVGTDVFIRAMANLSLETLLVRSSASTGCMGCLVSTITGKGLMLKFYLKSGDGELQNLVITSESRGPDSNDFGLYAERIGLDNDVPEIAQFLSVVLGSLLLDVEDRSLVNPVLLNKDLPKLSRIGEVEAIDRAKRRGVIGWDLGRSLESVCRSAHYRNAHLCLFRTGPGRSTPVIKFRSGAFVKPTNRISVPTGYLGVVE